MIENNVIESAKEIFMLTRRSNKPIMPFKEAVKILRTRGYTVSRIDVSGSGAKGGIKE